MTVHVVGIGLDGAAGLKDEVCQLVGQATLLIGSDRHLSYFPNHRAERIVLGDFTQAIGEIRRRLSLEEAGNIVVLVSGDPLFFGLGRLLLAALPSEHLTFHPHLSSVQLAFSRVKVAWQDACIISAHGRSFDELTQVLQQGVEKIAVLTDEVHTPSAIALHFLSLDLPSRYQFWVCENLGGIEERVRVWSAAALQHELFDPLNVVVLLRQSEVAAEQFDASTLPFLGLPDRSFLSFSDRPGLMTKREVRTLILGELALQPGQIIWDVGAGTGSVSIEIARLFPTSAVYAVEKTTAGTTLIEQNCQRFQTKNVVSIHGTAPEILHHLPQPHRIFIGGSGGNLSQILSFCGAQLPLGGVLVLALATLEHLNTALTWASDSNRYPFSSRRGEQPSGLTLRERIWKTHLLQVQLSRSVSIGQLTRFSPLNPVTILTATRSGR